MAAAWQQILALDARYNTLRAPVNPQFRTQYIRRRSQLLQEYSKESKDPNVRKQYLKLRSQLLAHRYGYIGDQNSLRSHSLSGRSNSRITLETTDSGEFLEVRRGSQKLATNDGLVPTHAAEASRAIVGGTTISENYAFAGVHHIFDQHTDAVTTVRFANDDKSRLACCSLDGTLAICQVFPPPPSVLFVLRGHTQGVTGFEWSASNDLIVSCSLDRTVRLWATSSGKCLRVVDDSTSSPVYACVFQPMNNNILVTGNGKGLVQVLNVSTGIYAKGGLAKMPGKVMALVFDMGGGYILWAGDDKGNIISFLFDLPSGRLTKGRRIIICEGRPITSLSSRSWISREARDPSLLVNCAVNMLYLLRVVDDEGSLQLRTKFPIRHENLNIKSSFCPMMSFRQGACVVSGSEDSCVYFFDVEREHKSCVNKLQGHSFPVLDVCFNYDESLLATSDAQGMVIIWKREQR